MKIERVFLLSVVFILLLGWAWMGGEAQRASVDTSSSRILQTFEQRHRHHIRR